MKVRLDRVLLFRQSNQCIECKESKESHTIPRLKACFQQYNDRMVDTVIRTIEKYV